MVTRHATGACARCSARTRDQRGLSWIARARAAIDLREQKRERESRARELLEQARATIAEGDHDAASQVLDRLLAIEPVESRELRRLIQEAIDARRSAQEREQRIRAEDRRSAMEAEASRRRAEAEAHQARLRAEAEARRSSEEYERRSKEEASRREEAQRRSHAEAEARRRAEEAARHAKGKADSLEVAADSVQSIEPRSLDLDTVVQRPPTAASPARVGRSWGSGLFVRAREMFRWGKQTRDDRRACRGPAPNRNPQRNPSREPSGPT